MCHDQRDGQVSEGTDDEQLCKVKLVCRKADILDSSVIAHSFELTNYIGNEIRH